MNKIAILVTTLILYTLLMAVGVAQAQVGEIEVTSLDPLSININPSYPEPGETVTAQVVSTVYNLNSASISWTIDGKIVAGENGNTLVFKAGAMGSRKLVSVTVRTQEGIVLSESVGVTPSTVDLIWESPTSYTPPFYRGKALPAAGTTLNLVAIPDIRNSAGTKLATNNLMFIWTQNGRVLNEVSGRGKNTITVPGPELYRDFEIRLEVTSADKTLGARGYLQLAPTTPVVHFYENHPTLGIQLEHALTSESITSGEIEVTAQPYYFDTQASGASDIRYTWSVNGSPVTNPSEDKSFIILRPTGSGGEAYISVVAEHVTQIFQQASRSFDVQFTGDATQNAPTF